MEISSETMGDMIGGYCLCTSYKVVNATVES